MQIDPAELRRRNLIPATSMPYRTSFQFEYDCGEFEANLDKALELSHYATFPQRQAQARQRGHLRGIGIATFLEISGAGWSPKDQVSARFGGALGYSG